MSANLVLIGITTFAEVQ